MPMVTNLIGTMDRFAMACGFPRGESVQQYEKRFLECLNHKNWRKPKLVETGPVKEVILKGEDVDLNKLPIFRWNSGDGGAYITQPVVITKDERFGSNAGIYRMMVHDRNHTGLMCNIFQDSGIHLGRARNAGKNRMDCAVVIGADPAIYEAAVTKLALNEDELEFAAALRGGEPVEVVKCETVDLEVPANAEIILEGELTVNETKMEGPFGEWMGYHEEGMNLPIFEIKCITMRHDAIFQTTTEGHPYGDAEKIRMVTQISSFKRSAKERITGFHDAWLPELGRGYSAVVAIKKRYPGWGRVALWQAFGMPYVASSANMVIVVDDDINPADLDQVMWALSTRVDPYYDVIVTQPVGTYALNPAASKRPAVFGPTGATDISYCSKLGIDATLKMAEERQGRPAAIPVRPSPEMTELVKARWHEYGF